MIYLISEPNEEGDHAVVHPVLRCAVRIVSLINDGRIDASRRIGEASLTEQLHTPRATVRSALDHLEVVGLVKRIPRAGTYLTEVGPQEFCQTMDIRAALEALAVKQATARVRNSDLEHLRCLASEVDDLNQRALDGESVHPEVQSKDLDFHFSIVHLSGNQRLATLLAQQRLVEQTFNFAGSTVVLRPRRDVPIPTHLEIVEAIASYDPDRAETIIRRHILRTKELRVGAITGEII